MSRSCVSFEASALCTSALSLASISFGTVGRRLRGDLARDRAARARAIVHHELVAPDFAELTRHDARRDIDTAAGCESHEQSAGLAGISLRLRDAGDAGSHDRTQQDNEAFRAVHFGLLQKISAARATLRLPWRPSRPLRQRFALTPRPSFLASKLS
jgi:hypothetical protein